MIFHIEMKMADQIEKYSASERWLLGKIDENFDPKRDAFGLGRAALSNAAGGVTPWTASTNSNPRAFSFFARHLRE
jgi:hypothetical protein